MPLGPHLTRELLQRKGVLPRQKLLLHSRDILELFEDVTEESRDRIPDFLGLLSAVLVGDEDGGLRFHRHLQQDSGLAVLFGPDLGNAP